MWWKKVDSAGTSLAELIVTLAVASLVALGFLGLYSSLVAGTIIAKRQAVGLTLATNQMEYLKSLPYDNLAVSGGSILAANYIPAVSTKTIGNAQYKVTTSISYVDDAYDGCASYPTPAIRAQYCRNYSASTPSTIDTNPADYKVAQVTVTDITGSRVFSDINTQFSARVAETASTTGALFITVVDASGSPVHGAQVQVNNSTTSPTVALSDTTDVNGLAIFYGLPIDTSPDYKITASKTSYSTLATLPPSGSLQPTFANLTILSQQSSSLSLVIKPMGTPSLLMQVTDTSGTPIANAKIYVKGGYKRYTASTDTSYYYDTIRTTDTRPVSDATGTATLTSLVPGPYFFCGDDGSASCTVGGTTYYLAAAVPYSGTTSLSPVNVPTYDPANPPSQTFTSGGVGYLQKVQLLLTTNSNFPRVTSISPSVANVSAGNSSSFPFTVKGANLPCSTTASSCSSKVTLTQGSTVVTASCTSSVTTSLSCTADVSGFTAGSVAQLSVQTPAGTLNLPGGTQLGGMILEQ